MCFRCLLNPYKRDEELKYNLDNLVNRKDTGSLKWDCINNGSDNHLLPMWIADMDFPCADPILKAINTRVDGKILGYSKPMESYYHAVKVWFKKRFDWDLDANEIVKSPGIVPAIALLVKAFTDKGDGVIIQHPAYPPFTFLVKNNKREVVCNPLRNVAGKYFMDFDDLEEKAKNINNKMLILCSPHNPVGRVWTREELSKLVKICLDNDVLIISDEIHCDMLRAGVKHYPLPKISDDERIIVCTAPSKTFNIAGLQIANIVIKNKAMREKWRDELIGSAGLLGSNPLSICATEAAYLECDEWLENVRDYIDANFQFVDQYLKSNLPKARFNIPEGTYFAWIDFRAYGHTYQELEKIMIEKSEVALSEGYTFGEEGQGFERINVACPRSILEEGLDRIKQYISA